MSACCRFCAKLLVDTTSFFDNGMIFEHYIDDMVISRTRCLHIITSFFQRLPNNHRNVIAGHTSRHLSHLASGSIFGGVLWRLKSIHCLDRPVYTRITQIWAISKERPYSVWTDETVPDKSRDWVRRGRTALREQKHSINSIIAPCMSMISGLLFFYNSTGYLAYDYRISA